MDEETEVELISTNDRDYAVQICELLEAEELPFRLSENDRQSMSTDLVGEQLSYNYFVLVPKDSVEKTREVLSELVQEEELPADHFLHESSDEEISEILLVPEEWDAFVYGHAKRIAVERGITTEQLDDTRQNLVAKFEQGKAAFNPLLIGLIMICGIGLGGVVYGSYLRYSKVETSVGTYLKYDEESRKMGALIMILGFVVFLPLLMIRIINL